jgi:hypothetical protein
MNWKFWKNEANAGITHLPKPRELPQPVGQFMVAKLKQDPDIIWTYKAVLMPREGSDNAFLIRIYNPAATNASGLKVVNYTSLDAAADFILFQGWYDKSSGKVELARPDAAAPKAA